MKTWLKVSLIALATALPAFVLGPIIWPPAAHGVAPTGLRLLLFMGLAALNALTFGLGVAFICLGLPLVQRVAAGSRAHIWITFAATAWLLISWWPHDNMHKHNGMDLDGLLMIDYLFHVPMMIAGAVLAYSLLHALQMVPTTRQAEDQRIAHAATGD